MARAFRSLFSVIVTLWASILAFSVVALAAHPGAGTYFGVIQGMTYDQTGYVRVVVGKSGTGSVSVKLGDQSTCVVEVGPGGPIGGPITYHPINPNPPMQVTLTLVTLPQGGTALSGTIIDDWGDILKVTLPNAAPAANTGTLAGRYTLVFETPSAGSAFTNDIAGFGTLRIFKTGHLIFHGTLSDGSSVFQLGTLNSSGNWELFAKSHGRTLSGEVDFADETETDCTGDLELAGPGKNGGPETDVSMQLVGSYYDPTLWWKPDQGWTLATSDDGGATVAFTSTLAAKGDLLYGGIATSAQLSTITSFASIYLEQGTGLIVGGYGSGLLDFHGVQGVLYQKTSSAFGLTTSAEKLPSLGQLKSIGGANLPLGNSFKSRLSNILGLLKPHPTGIFSVETNPAASGLGGLESSDQPNSSNSNGTFGGSITGNLNFGKNGTGQLSGLSVSGDPTTSGFGSSTLGATLGGTGTFQQAGATLFISGDTVLLDSTDALEINSGMSFDFGALTGSNPYFIIH